MTRVLPNVEEIKSAAQTAIERCRKLSSFTEEPGRTTRTFLSPPMRDCHREIAQWMEPLGAEIKIDDAGNIRATYAAADPHAARLLVGSHLDTVPNAGAFDGILGVVLAISLIENLHGERLPFAIEVVGFSEEEGVRFGTPFIGSRALVGRIDEEILSRKDAQGVSVGEAIENFGLNPRQIRDACLQGEIMGFLEFHIEQGPVLEDLGLPLGVVEAIAGQSRSTVTFLGRANHAGTTPMDRRRDAIAAAAEWITAVEREAKRVPGLVATVGTVRSKPGVTNVIAGEAELGLDVRHSADDVRIAAVENMNRMGEEIALRRGLSMRHGALLSQPSVAMDPVMVSHVEEAFRRSRCVAHRMVSGAGHDAMILAQEIPTAMIFLRTPGGISHTPEENVNPQDVEMAIEAGWHFLDVLGASPALKGKKVQRA
ncbi:MAG TPA: allantoate amidohydrolase [Terriglobia bacterium]|nr:allantoate amidohydrolase [Terriglobia bacterium]